MFPMYGKLAIRNMKRSAKTYSVYTVTLFISISLIFAFNSLVFSAPIRNLSRMMSALQGLLFGITALVTGILGWLIAYITRFIFEQRSREFACYMTMGMERKTISALFIREQLAIGAVLYVVGSLFGNVIYFGFCQIIFRLFEQPFTMDLSYILPAAGMTAVCFAGMYLFALVRQNLVLKKIRVKALLEYDRQNEYGYCSRVSESGTGAEKRWNPFGIILFAVTGVLSFLCLYGTTQISTIGGQTELLLFSCGAMLQIVSLLIVYREVSGLLCRFFRKNRRIRLKNMNLFFYRQLAGKMKTNGTRMGVLSVMVLVSALCLAGTILLVGNFNEALSRSVPFDVEIAQFDGEVKEEKYRELIGNQYGIEQEHVYPVYDLELGYLKSVMGEGAAYSSSSDSCIALSDYNRLREMLGMPQTALAPDEFLVHSEVAAVAEKIGKAGEDLTLSGRQFRFRGTETGYFAQEGINGYYALIVLPDEACEGLTLYSENYVADTKLPAKEELLYDLRTIRKEMRSEGVIDGYTNILTYEAVKKELQTTNLMFAFMACYIGLVCLFIIAAILAVQQMSECVRYRKRYGILNKLGADYSSLRRLVWKQNLAYFGLPLLIPFGYAVIYLAGILRSGLFEVSLVLTSFFGAIGLIAAVYGCYFLITVNQYQRGVLKGMERNTVKEMAE